MATKYRMCDTRRPDGVHITFEREVCVDDEASPLDWMDERDPADRERIQAWRNGDWHFIGIRAVARIAIVRNGVAISHTMVSAGLWGIESDSGDDYLNEVFRDECDALKQDIRALGTFEG